MMAKRRGRLILLSSVVAVAAVVTALFSHGRRGADGAIVTVHIGGDSPRGIITVQLLSEGGNPRAGVGVASESGSGTLTRITDESGIARIRPSETEVLGLYIGGEKLWVSPYAGTLFDSVLSPSCGRGLRFCVRLKSRF